MLKQIDEATVTTIGRNSPLTAGPLGCDAVFAADDFSWRRESPFRPPDWRWKLANRLLVEKLPRRPETKDPWVRRIARHLRPGRVVEGLRSPRRASYDHVLAEASAIRFAADPLIGGEVEAWVLTGEPTPVVAGLSGLDEPVVEAYERCFFDVRPKLEAWSYVIHIVIGPGVYEGFRLDDLPSIWKMIAYFRGRYSLAVTLQAFPGTRLRPWPDWYEASPEEQARLIEACRGAVLARCLPRVLSSAKDLELILELLAALEAKREEQFRPLGAAVPLLSSEDMSPVVDMAERDEPVPSPTQSSTVINVAPVMQTA
jgi:hypothetical protein